MREGKMLELIKSRRSIRKFTEEPVSDEILNTIIEMGTWAPSGQNNQPWKFVIIRDPGIKSDVARCTKFSRIIENAPVCIAVFLDNSISYDRVKDIQAIGACIQNMLLAIHSMGLGAVWLGEILKNRQKVEEILKVPPSCELMAVVALGHPAEKRQSGHRNPIDKAILNRF